MTDFEAHELYPRDNWVYDKEAIARLYGVKCGMVIPDDKTYIVKPRVNLQGCGIGSRYVQGLGGFKAPSGHRWFEYLEGKHWTIDFVRQDDGTWRYTNVYEGYKSNHNHKNFDKWVRTTLELFDWGIVLDSIKSTPIVNFEVIGNKPIEVHLRGNTDPVQWDEFVPVWETNERACRVKYEPLGYKFIEDKEDHPERIGFWVKNYG